MPDEGVSRRTWRLGAHLILFLVSVAPAQRVSFPNDGQYRPGEYAPMTIEADQSGAVKIRGPEMIGIDWNAPGKSSITIPWICWKTSPGDVAITLNDRAATVSLNPLQPGENFISINPYAMPDNVIGPKNAMYSEAAYLPTYSWTPGRPKATREMIALVSILAILVLATIRLSLGKSKWMPVFMIVAGVGLAILFSRWNELSRRDSRLTVRILSDDPPQSDAWLYVTGRDEARLEIPWLNNMLIPRSPAHLRALDPVLKIDSSGAPRAISVQINPDRIAAFLIRQIGTNRFDSDTDNIISPALARQLYGRDFVVDRRDGATMRLIPASGSR